jgi:hypothetical protein
VDDVICSTTSIGRVRLPVLGYELKIGVPRDPAGTALVGAQVGIQHRVFGESELPIVSK